MAKYYIKKSSFIILLLICCIYVPAQNVINENQSRTKLNLSYKMAKNWKLVFSPEVRFNDLFSMDKYIFELGTQYTPVKKLMFGAEWRYVVNQREKKATEYLQRYAFDAKYKSKIGRWKPTVRMRYTNYSEDSDAQFLRYKAGLDFNIKKCKLTPLGGLEVFHHLDRAEIFKVRYTLGATYKLSKRSSFVVAYKLDYYMQKYKNKHIIQIGYKLKI